MKLSGVEQQRGGIAGALSSNPGIIIADEPTGNLDPENENQVLSILKSLAHEEKNYYHCYFPIAFLAMQMKYGA